MGRTEKHRNFCGAFLGGFTGIVACGLVAPVFLPLGCLVGVILGFWYDQIWEMIVRSWQTSLAAEKRKYRAANDHLLAGFIRLNLKLTVSCALLSRMLGTVVRAGKFVGSGCKNLIIRLIAWWKTDPTSHALVSRSLSTTAYILCQAIWALPLGRQVFVMSSPGKSDDVTIFCFLGFLVFCVITAMVPLAILIPPDEEEGKPKRQDELVRAYQTRGAFRFFVKDIWRLVTTEAKLSLWLATLALYGIIAGGLLFFLAAVPFTGAILIARGIYDISRRPDHWPCFIITIVVTSASAWLCHNYLHGTSLWLIALTTGIVSAVATEKLRSFLKLTIERSPRLSATTTRSIASYLTPSWDLFLRGGRKIHDVDLNTQWV